MISEKNFFKIDSKDYSDMIIAPQEVNVCQVEQKWFHAKRMDAMNAEEFTYFNLCKES